MTDISEDFIDGHHFLEMKEHIERYVFPKLESEVHSGMELRDYFAAKMLPIAFKTTTNAWAVARMSYEYADAMIEVRKEGKK